MRQGRNKHTFPRLGAGSLMAGVKTAASVARTIMFIGSSTYAAGSTLPNLPAEVGVQSVSPDYSTLNTNGDFLQRTYLSKNTDRTAGGVLRYRAADKSLTWQSFGDTEGPRVSVTSAHMWYTLQSGASGSQLFVETIPSYAPNADATITFPAPVSNLWKYENVSTNGLSGWTQLLLGEPFKRSVSYTKSSASLADMRAAYADWAGDVTDITCIYMGTNDVSNRTTCLRALQDMEFIVTARLAVGSAVVVGGILPRNGRSAEALQAVGEFNLRLREMGERLGFIVWDAWPYTAQPNGDWISGFSTDGTHMTSATTYMVAKRVCVPAMKSLQLAPPANAPVMALYDPVLAPYGNLLTNPTLTGAVAVSGVTGVSGTLPTNWTVSRGTGSTITAVCTAGDASGSKPLPNGKQGKFTSIAVNNANASAVAGESIVIRSFNSTMTNIAEGDLVIAEGEFQVQGTDMNSLYVVVAETATGAVTSVYAIQGNVSGLGSLEGDTITVKFRTSPMRLSAGVTKVTINITLSMKVGGTATVDLPPAFNIYKVPVASA